MVMVIFIGSEEPWHRGKAIARTMEARGATSSDYDYDVILPLYII